VTTKAAIEDFVSQQTLAVVGVSSGGKKFGNAASKHLRAKGYRMIPVHPTAETIDGERCYSSLGALPEPVGGVLVVVPPAETENVVRDAAAAGIRRVWMQQGAQSAAAIQFCEDQGLSVIHDECILMFAEPVRGGHRFHRFIWRLLGKLPT
jgi:predicted CoA-binding protein